MDKKNIDFGNKFKTIRKAIGLNQKDFAKKLGIRQAYYSLLEQGKKDPSTRVIDALWALGVSFDWFYKGEGNIFDDIFEVRNLGNKNIDDGNNMYANFVQSMSENECKLIESNKNVLADYYGGTPLLPNNYEYLLIKYYDQFSTKRIKELVSLEKEDLEKAYNARISLTSFLHYLNPPEFLKDKFPEMKPFPLYFNEFTEDFKEEIEDIDDTKLCDILFIIRLKEDIRHEYYLLGKLIDYMKRYEDIIYRGEYTE